MFSLFCPLEKSMDTDIAEISRDHGLYFFSDVLGESGAGLWVSGVWEAANDAAAVSSTLGLAAVCFPSGKTWGSRYSWQSWTTDLCLGPTWAGGGSRAAQTQDVGGLNTPSCLSVRGSLGQSTNPGELSLLTFAELFISLTLSQKSMCLGEFQLLGEIPVLSPQKPWMCISWHSWLCRFFFWQKLLFSAALRNQDLFYCLFNKKTYLFNKKEMIKVLGNNFTILGQRSTEQKRALR